MAVSQGRIRTRSKSSFDKQEKIFLSIQAKLFQLAIYYGGMRPVADQLGISESTLSQYTNPEYRRLPSHVAKKGIDELHAKIERTGGPPTDSERYFQQWSKDGEHIEGMMNVRLSRKISEARVTPMKRSKRKPAVNKDGMKNPILKVQMVQKFTRLKKVTLPALQELLSQFDSIEEINLAIELLQECRK